MSTRSWKNARSGGGGGAGLESHEHVPRASRTSAASSPASAGRTSTAKRLRAVERQVRLEPVPAALAPEAGLLVAAERAPRGAAVERVRPDDAGAQAFGHPEDPRALLRPHARREAVRRVVRLLDRLVGRAER